MLIHRYVIACAIITLTAQLWSNSADHPNLCPKDKLEKIIKGSEVGSIDYSENYDNAAALAERKISIAAGQLQFAELQSQKIFGAKFPERTKDLINRFINSGSPHFSVIYHCPSQQIIDVKMYADYWGVEAMPVSEDKELPVAKLYAIGKKYRGAETLEGRNQGNSE